MWKGKGRGTLAEGREGFVPIIASGRNEEGSIVSLHDKGEGRIKEVVWMGA